MQSTSKPLYVYLQRPDNGEWVTVGRYQAGPAAGKGYFRYAPSYIDAAKADGVCPRPSTSSLILSSPQQR